MIIPDDVCNSPDIKSNNFNGRSRAVSDRRPAFQAATSSDQARAAVRRALLVSIVQIKVKVMGGQFVLTTKHLAAGNINVIYI